MQDHELIEILEEQNQQETENDAYWQFKQISDPQGLLSKDDLKYKGWNYNDTVEEEDGSITHEPLNIFSCNAPDICPEYGQKHNLLNEPGWKWFHHITKLKGNFNV